MIMNLIKASMTGGILAKSLHARVDLAKYATGLVEALNVFIKAHGGASNRAGWEMTCEIKDSNAVGRLMPFSFNTEQTYAMELGDYFLRIVKDGGRLLLSASPSAYAGGTTYAHGDYVVDGGINYFSKVDGNVGNTPATSADEWHALEDDIVEIPTPWPTADLALLKIVQSADVLTVTHPSYDPYDLARTAQDVWLLTSSDFVPQQPAPTGIAVTVNSTGSETYRYAVTAVNEETAEESLRGAGATTAISAATAANPVVVTATAHGKVNGDTITIDGVVGMTQLNGRQFRVSNKTTNTLELSDEDGSGHTAYVSGGTLAAAFVEITNGHATTDNTITWNAAVGAGSYNIYRERNGIFGFVGRSEALTFDEKNVDPDTGDSPPKYRDPFFGADNKPGVSTYFQQRKVFARTNNKTQGMFFTQSGNYYNMTHSSPFRDDDAITRTIAAQQVNEIRWLVPLDKLIVLTSGGEWKVDTSEGGTITPLSIQVRPQGYRGAANVPPLVIGNTVLFVQSRGARVRDLAYAIESDSFTGNDLSVLAEDLFEGYTIKEWCYAQEPYSIIWCVRSDGALLGMTYLREHEVWAWHRHETDGTFESICSIPEGSEDAVYAIVKRDINGTTKRFIERMHTRRFTDIKDGFFVDCGLTYDDPKTITAATAANPVVVSSVAHGYSNGDLVDIEDVIGMTELNGNRYTVANKTADTYELSGIDGSAFTAYVSGGVCREALTTINGLSHLNGRTDVVALADGWVVRNLTVTAGAITLPTPASRVHAGLGYSSVIETLNPEYPAGSTAQGRLKRVASVTLRAEDTIGIEVGPTIDDLTPARQCLTEMVTGDISVNVTPRWNTNGRITIRQTNPWPMSISAIIPEIERGN